MPRELDELLTARDRAWLHQMGEEVKLGVDGRTYDALSAAYERLELECAGAHRAARRNRSAFVKATIIAAVMCLAAITGWLTVWFRG